MINIIVDLGSLVNSSNQGASVFILVLLKYLIPLNMASSFKVVKELCFAVFFNSGEMLPGK